MATGDFFGNLKQKARALYNNFFYEGEEAPAPQQMQEEAYPQQEQPYQQQAPQGYAQQQAYQAPYAQAYQPQQQSYQQQAYQQQAYQQPQQPVYQNSAYQQQQHRNRRAQQHQENNVVDFGAYQQNNAAYQQPQQGYQPQAAPQQEQPQAQAPAAPASEMPSARVINARGMGDCRSAITLLRNGDAVIIVLENVTDPAEMRRLVDTLSGACYSLTATITKLSRYGAYLLAPQTMAVYTDQVTNQMNGAPGRPQPRNYQPNYTANAPQRPAYQPQQAPQMNYAPQQGFIQRAAAPEEAAQPFYARTAPQQAQPPAFSAQPTGYGYVPDEMEAVDQ